MFGDGASGSRKNSGPGAWQWLQSRAVAAALAAAVTGVSACTPPDPNVPGPQSTEPALVMVEINQSRDQYGKQAILLQFTNISGGLLAVAGARLSSPLFRGGISWEPTGGALELPPGQPKSVPVRLPDAACAGPAPSSGDASGSVLLAEPGQSSPREVAAAAGDPFGVLVRNNSELCLAAEASTIADIALDPQLMVALDGRSAVVRLVVSPKAPPDGTPRSLTIDSIQETTLLAELPEDRWPRNITVMQGSPRTDWPLSIRPARCDPHAIAEDKVGTLLPLRVRVSGREGPLKVDAGAVLRAQLYDFVTTACREE